MVKAVEKPGDGLARRRDNRPIDLVHLARQTLGDSDLEAEILVMFDQIARSYVKRLRLEAGNGDALSDLHALKGAAFGVGATALANIAREAEVETRQTGMLSAERIDDLEMAVEETGTFIAGLLADGKLAS